MEAERRLWVVIMDHVRDVYGPNCVQSVGSEISVWVLSDLKQTALVTIRTGVEMGWATNKGTESVSWEASLSGSSVNNIRAQEEERFWEGEFWF